MKKTVLTVMVAGAFAMGSTMLAGCGGNPKTDGEQEHMDGDEHGHMESEDHEHMEMEGEEGHHHEDSGHMKHMMDVKKWLKQELGDQYDSPVPEATAEQLAAGKKIFMTTCSPCHGMTGKGDGPAGAALNPKPADLTDPEHSRFYSDAGRLHIITKGSPGTGMVAWENSFTADQIRSIFAYVRSLRPPLADDGHDYGNGNYTCSMHPEVSGNKGGKCPKCGMTLVPKEQEHHDGEEHEETQEHGHEH